MVSLRSSWSSVMPAVSMQRHDVGERDALERRVLVLRADEQRREAAGQVERQVGDRDRSERVGDAGGHQGGLGVGVTHPGVADAGVADAGVAHARVADAGVADAE